MENLTDTQLKTRWTGIKRVISERQLLAFKIGIPPEIWDTYMHSIPPPIEIDRIYNVIQEDRKEKTMRIKEGLSKIVGYREAKEFSRKSGVSDTSIREIIEGKKTSVGYDVINKLEVFLSITLADFEISIENPLTIESYTTTHLNEITSEADMIANRLKNFTFRIAEVVKKQDYGKQWDWDPLHPSKHISDSIQSLLELKFKVDAFWEVYTKRKNEAP